MIRVVFDGRPLRWARVARGAGGRGYTPARQREHRRALAKAIQFSPGAREITGPARLEVLFDYVHSTTILTISDAEFGRGTARGADGKNLADIDNLVKQVMEAAQDSGVVGNDCQFVELVAKKIDGGPT